MCVMTMPETRSATDTTDHRLLHGLIAALHVSMRPARRAIQSMYGRSDQAESIAGLNQKTATPAMAKRLPI